MKEEKKVSNKEKSKKLASEFKKFIMRGNVIDLAVGVIVGGAFSKIVTSLVDNVLMPLIGVIIGGIDFTSLKLSIGGAEVLYGVFIQNVIDFLIIAVCIFAFIKIINNVFNKEKKKEEVEKKSVKSEEVVLLTEIRDLLKSSNSVKVKAKKKINKVVKTTRKKTTSK